MKQDRKRRAGGNGGKPGEASSRRDRTLQLPTEGGSWLHLPDGGLQQIPARRTDKKHAAPAAPESPVKEP